MASQRFLSAPAPNDLVCAPCRSVFDSCSEPEKVTIETIHVNRCKPHHLTLESFRGAVSLGCYLCTRFDKDIFSHLKLTIADPLPQPLTFRTAIAAGSENQASMLSLSVNKDCVHEDSNEDTRISWFQFCLTNRAMPLNCAASERFDLLKSWISECTENHAMCQKWRFGASAETKLKRPMSLISIGRGDKTGCVKLVEVADQYPAYAALSCCWDTTTEQLFHSFSGDSWQTISTLPRGLQEAVEIATVTGLDFLWIPHLSEDLKHSPDIYLGSVLNIAVISCSNINDSWLPSTQAHIPIVTTKWNPSHPVAIFDPGAFGNVIIASPLYKTPSFHLATLLAPATLYCTGRQLWWQCAEPPLKSETYPLGPLLVLRTHQLLEPKLVLRNTPRQFESFDQQLAALWISIITSYSNTAPGSEGRVDVIERIADRLRSLVPYIQPSASFAGLTYSSGFWSPELVLQLTWHVSLEPPLPSEGGSGRPSVVPLPCRARDQVPTWSWQSVDGPVGFSFFGVQPMPGCISPCLYPGFKFAEPVAEIVSFGPDKLCVRGRLFPVEMMRSSDRRLENMCDARYIISSSPPLLKDGQNWTVSVLIDCAEELEILKGEEMRYWILPLMAHDFAVSELVMSGLCLRESTLVGTIAGTSATKQLLRCGWCRYDYNSMEGRKHSPVDPSCLSLSDVELREDVIIL